MPRPSPVDRFLNSKGRSGRHVATGLAVTAGVGLVASALVALTADPRETSPEHDGRPIVQKPRLAWCAALKSRRSYKEKIELAEGGGIFATSQSTPCEVSNQWAFVFVFCVDEQQCVRYASN